jgi:hypothetical protein
MSFNSFESNIPDESRVHFWEGLKEDGFERESLSALLFRVSIDLFEISLGNEKL